MAFVYLAAQFFLMPDNVAVLKKRYEGRLAEVAAEREKLKADIQRFRQAREGMNAALASLGRQVGTMQARVTRLDSLGQRVIQVAGLDDGEFDFSAQPAMGGPDSQSDIGGPMSGQNLTELASQVERLSKRIGNRQGQLDLLQGMIDRRQVREEMRPDGWPTEGGWLSSDFGKRIDPFSGQPAYHYGVDIANHKGSDVEAMAPGLVTWSGERYGYGDLVEIDHGNGYRTRYAHNKEITVSVGERVAKGATVGKVGKSGRSTGPHLHLEVLHNGDQIDPREFLNH
ncbi:M23 family metallopeptidase [Thiohalorhabdus sp.]|uniref:M23 family metallopeptidase n=1 Tax=Thiohalorhabdus sp. TaxID=3094134 RepID=UPI002FC29816